MVLSLAAHRVIPCAWAHEGGHAPPYFLRLLSYRLSTRS